MTTLDEAIALAAGDSGLAVVATVRGDGSVQASLVNVGALVHPVSGERALAFVTYGRVKLANLRARPELAVTFRDGWRWATVEGLASGSSAARVHGAGLNGGGSDDGPERAPAPPAVAPRAARLGDLPRRRCARRDQVADGLTRHTVAEADEHHTTRLKGRRSCVPGRRSELLRWPSRYA